MKKYIKKKKPIVKRPPKTLKEMKFVKEYIRNGGNAKEAAMKVYDAKTPGSAKSIGSENLSRLDLQGVFRQYGLTPKKLVERLNEGVDANRTISANVIIKMDDPTVKDKKATAREVDFIDVPDWQARLKAIEMTFKLMDLFPAEKHAIATGGADLIEQWKLGLGIDEKSLRRIRAVDDDGVSEETLPISESDQQPDTQGNSI